MVGPHPAGPLEQRFDDDPGEFVAVPVAEGVDGRAPLVDLGIVGAGCRRRRGEDLGSEHGMEVRVHARDGIAHAHRAGGVAVVGPAQGEEAAAVTTACLLILDGEFEGDLDRHGTGVGEEDVVEAARGDSDEAFGEFDGRGVGEPAEHHMGEGLRTGRGRRRSPGCGIRGRRTTTSSSRRGQ